MIRYRYITPEDTEIYDLIRECQENTPVHAHKKFCPERTRDVVNHLIQDKWSLAILGEEEESGDTVGILLATCTQELFSKDMIATAVFWYSTGKDPRVSLHLADLFEAWAQSDESVTTIRYSTPDNARLDRYYTKKGFRNIERVYDKEI